MMQKESEKISLIIPTYRGGAEFENLLKAVSADNGIFEIIVVETRSEMDVSSITSKYGAKLIRIEKEDFDHGHVRTVGCKAAKGNILVFLTQDSMPKNNISIIALVKPLLENSKIAVSYGRQLPCPDANPFATHLRLFNYPPNSEIKTINDRARKGIKTAFISNSFSAYRKSALEEIGWFKTGLLLGEDFHAGAKLLEKGYAISYTADAEVYHSHNYTMEQEFKRYFDIGVVHRREAWILKRFGRPEKEGFKFVFSEISYLIKTGKFYLAPVSIVRAAVKFIGYKLGYSYTLLPSGLMEKCTMMGSIKDSTYD